MGGEGGAHFLQDRHDDFFGTLLDDVSLIAFHHVEGEFFQNELALVRTQILFDSLDLASLAQKHLTDLLVQCDSCSRQRPSVAMDGRGHSEQQWVRCKSEDGGISTQAAKQVNGTFLSLHTHTWIVMDGAFDLVGQIPVFHKLRDLFPCERLYFQDIQPTNGIAAVTEWARGENEAVPAVGNHLLSYPFHETLACLWIGDFIKPIKQDEAVSTLQTALNPIRRHLVPPLTRVNSDRVFKRIVGVIFDRHAVIA